MALQWSWAVVEMCSFKLSSSREPGGGGGERERDREGERGRERERARGQ